MAIAKTNIPVTGTVISSSATTWYTVAECVVPVSTGIFMIRGIWLLGKNGTLVNVMGSFVGEHRGYILSGTIGFIGTLTAIISFSTGSGGPTSLYGLSEARINQSGSTLQLQVKPATSASTEWYGGFTLIVN